jgi:hypothetical protein
MMTTATKPKRVTKGMQFRHVYADSNALWEVVKRVGDAVWECEIVGEPIEINGEIYQGDYVGQVDVFKSELILRSIELSSLFQNIHEKSDNFIDGLESGKIVHYDSSFGQYVRCEIVDSNEFTDDKKRPEITGKALKPIALVGNWHKRDLPHRTCTGQVYYPYHSQNIIDGTIFRPNAGCIYEYPDHNDKFGTDPAELEPINLTVPDLTPIEEKQADLWSAVVACKAILEENRDDPKGILQEVLRTVNKALEG